MDGRMVRMARRKEKKRRDDGMKEGIEGDKKNGWMDE